MFFDEVAAAAVQKKDQDEPKSLGVSLALHATCFHSIILAIIFYLFYEYRYNFYFIRNRISDRKSDLDQNVVEYLVCT